MPSFDVVSRINYQEFDNALANCLREIATRYDFKGLNISIERKDKTITTLAPDNLKLKQVNELLQTHLIRRKVDPRVINIKNSETATGGTVRQISELKEGIDQESAKKIITQIKSLKLKIQVKIQGEELRADGKKRDDLQEAIAAIRTIDIDFRQDSHHRAIARQGRYPHHRWWNGLYIFQSAGRKHRQFTSRS